MHGVTGVNDTSCVFCEIATGRLEASVVAHDALTITFIDLRQFHPGHVLVIPRQHFNDIRDMDDASLQAVMSAVARVARAIDQVFPGDGLSIWHSAGEGANQEVPHAHFHVHPRFFKDRLLDVYPHAPKTPSRASLDAIAGRLRAAMTRSKGGD
jgi:histidine triad (HIT) family protein